MIYKEKLDFQYCFFMFLISCIEEAKKLYPGRVSVDLIFGRPGQTLDGWKQELKQVRTNLFELNSWWLMMIMNLNFSHSAKHFINLYKQEKLFFNLVIV